MCYLLLQSLFRVRSTVVLLNKIIKCSLKKYFIVVFSIQYHSEYELHIRKEPATRVRVHVLASFMMYSFLPSLTVQQQ